MKKQLKTCVVWMWCDQCGTPWRWTASATRALCRGNRGDGAELKDCHKYVCIPVLNPAKRRRSKR